ncbi:MAG: pitrilysin family protein [Bacteroidia bacterium]|nr:pitrilysin family protein [Bacteroidia bacterium]
MQQLAPYVWYWLRPQASSLYILLLRDIGSRHDPPHQEGLLHFLEHALFKGTRRRTAKSLFSRIERHGGELNAFTTKDKMGIEIRVPPSSLALALSTLWELMHEATFPPHELEKEREVILEELVMYEDIPEESLIDHFEEEIFIQGGLRHPVIGYMESLRSIQREDLLTFYAEKVQRSRFVLLLTGPLPEHQVLRSIEKLDWAKVPSLSLSPPPERMGAPTTTHLPRPIQQAHLVIGGVGPSPYQWEESFPLQLLLFELGGGHMSSRLNLLLREKYGWSYSVYTFFHAYPEKSVWGIYAGLSPEAFEAARDLIRQELQKLINTPLSPHKVRIIKRAFIGKNGLLLENPIYRLTLFGRMLLDCGEYLDFRLWKDRVQGVEGESLQKAAYQFFRSLYERAYLPQSQGTKAAYTLSDTSRP